MVEKTGGENLLDVTGRPAFQTLAVNIPGIVYRVYLRERNRMEFFNDMVEKMTGFKNNELKEGDVCSIDPIVIPDDRLHVIEVVKDALRENKPFEVEYRITRKNGGIRYFLERGQPIYGSDGKAEFIDGVILDITDRKRSEMELSESEEKFRSVLENSIDAIYRRNLETNEFDYLSPALVRVTGFTPDELKDVGIDEVLERVHPDDRHLVTESMDHVSKSGKGLLQYRFRAKDGKYRWLAVSLSVVKDKEGRPSHRVGVIRDITSSKQTEKTLLFKENIINSSSSVIATCDLEGNMTYGNPSFLKAWGFDDPKEFIGRPFWEFWLVEDRLDEIMQALRGNGYWLGEIKAKRKDGGIFDVQVSTATVFDNGSQPVALTSTSIDITERKRAEEALRESEERLRLAVETAELAIWDWDVTEDTVRWDDPCETLFYGPVKKDNAYEWWTEHIHPEDRNAVLSKFDDAMADGKEFLVVEYRFQCPDGDWKDIYDRCHIMRDESGQLFRVVGAVMDVTGLRRAERELRQARDELEFRVMERTAELELKNRELQDFAFVASHDLSEPLRKIETFGRMLVDRCGGGSFDEVSKDYLKRMQKATARMQNLLHSLLLYSRVTTKAEPLKKTDLNKSVQGALSNLEMVIGEKNAEVEVGDLPTIEEADRVQMIQLFQNLIGNALKFSREGVTPHVKIYEQEDRRTEGAYEICVEDNGIGFDEKYLDKIFLPFQRLHGRSSEYEGEGMGLAICRKIVERNGGEITAKSESGKGSNFTVTLPINRKTE